MNGGNRILSHQICEGLGLVEMHPVFGEGIGGTDCFQVGLHFEPVWKGKAGNGCRPILCGAGKLLGTMHGNPHHQKMSETGSDQSGTVQFILKVYNRIVLGLGFASLGFRFAKHWDSVIHEILDPAAHLLTIKNSVDKSVFVDTFSPG